MAIATRRFPGLRLFIALGITFALSGNVVSAGVSPTEAAVEDDAGVAPNSTPAGTEVEPGLFVEAGIATWAKPGSEPFRAGFVDFLTMLPEFRATGGNDFSAWFTVEVLSGAICYTQVSDPPGGSVFAQAFPGETDPSVCAGNGVAEEDILTSCNGCVLGAGDTVYLPEGSLLTHVGLSTHTYANPDSAKWAELIAVGSLAESTPACVGTCWRW